MPIFKERSKGMCVCKTEKCDEMPEIYEGFYYFFLRKVKFNLMASHVWFVA